MVSVTKRRNEGALCTASSAQLLGAAADRASMCIAILAGRDLRFVYVNPAHQALSPGTPMLGRVYSDVFPEATRAGVEAVLHKALDTGDTWRVVR